MIGEVLSKEGTSKPSQSKGSHYVVTCYLNGSDDKHYDDKSWEFQPTLQSVSTRVANVFTFVGVVVFILRINFVSTSMTGSIKLAYEASHKSATPNPFSLPGFTFVPCAPTLHLERVVEHPPSAASCRRRPWTCCARHWRPQPSF